jgi:uncharacterized protein DUF4397
MRKIRMGLAAAVMGATLLAAGPARAADTATVNVVHGIPGVAVNVCVDGTSVRDDFRFGRKIVGAELLAGSHRVKLVPSGSECSVRAILVERYRLHAGANVTIVANLDASGTPNLAVFANNVRPTSEGNARLSVRHTAAAPAVNVWANGSRLIGGTGFTWGKSETLEVPSDRYRVKVTLPGSKAPVIGPAVLDLAANKGYQVYAVGDAHGYRLVEITSRVGAR